MKEIKENLTFGFTVPIIELIIGLENVLKHGSLFSYLIHMTRRITEIYRVLKDSGSFYLHCDPTASHYLKIITDSIFCANRKGEYQNEIIWRRTGQHNKIKRYGPIHDVIFFYTKTRNFTWNFPKKAFMQGHLDENFIKDANGYKTNYYGNVLTGSGIRGGESGKAWKGFDPTLKDRHWAIPGALIEDLDEDLSQLTQHQKLDKLFELGMITIKKGEAWPVYERYLKPTDGQALPDIWAFQPYTSGTVFQTKKGIDEDVRWLSTKDRERLGYPTQKPEGLLERIISASTNIGDTVLDAYCGCGTTISVSQRLERQWVGIDITYQSISLILKRMEDSFGKLVSESINLNGVPQDMQSAIALANKKDDKTRKEFEKWAVLTYSKNRAIINEKKGGDGGIDGIVYMMDTDSKGKAGNKRVLFSVKSDKKYPPSYIRDLNGTVEREKAVLGFLITLYKADNLIKESKQYGLYKNQLLDREFSRIEVICVEDILKGVRMSIPTTQEVVKSAQEKTSLNQMGLF